MALMVTCVTILAQFGFAGQLVDRNLDSHDVLAHHGDDIGRRLELPEWAGKNSAYIIEDDCDGEYRYGHRTEIGFYPIGPLSRAAVASCPSKGSIFLCL